MVLSGTAGTVGTVQVKLSLPDELVVELDRLRGDVTRSRFVRRLVESVAGEPAILGPPRVTQRKDEDGRTVFDVDASGQDISPVGWRSPEPQEDSGVPRGSSQASGYEPAAERKVQAQMVRELAPRRHSPTCSCAVCKPPKA